VPTYEYECTSCGQHIEVFQRFSEEPLTTCGSCGGALRKVFHPAGIVFKGSGFYATDSRKKEPAASAGKKDGAGTKEGEAGAKAETSSGSSTGSKADGGSGSSTTAKETT
jgi:putative FmdB family regulatory protein